MRLIDLIRATRWTDVKHHLLEEYPDSDASAYERAYLNLRSLEVQENPMRIQLEWVEALEPGDAPYIDVNGYDGSLHRDREDFSMYSTESQASMGDKEVRYALDLTPWEEWLGMGIAAETLEGFKPAEIAAHCLWEMTWHGFDQAKTQAFRKQLNATATSLQAMTLEERSRNTIPIEDIEAAVDRAIQASRLETVPLIEQAMDQHTAAPGPLTPDQQLNLVGLMTQWNQAMGLYEMPPRPRKDEMD